MASYRTRGKSSHLGFSAWTVNEQSLAIQRVMSRKKKPILVQSQKDAEQTLLPPKKEKSAWAKIMDEFYERTTIQGVCQVGTRRSIIAKILWFIVAVMGISMAVYQSWEVIQDYHGKSIIQKMMFKSKNAPFPALTVCKTIYLRSKQPPSTANSQGSNEDDDQEFMNDGITPADSLLYIRRCKFGSVTCNLTDTDEILPWTNPRYGRCFTFNPGLNVVKTADAGSGLFLLLDITDNIGTNAEYDNVVLLVHQSGTAPVLDRTRLISVSAKDTVTIKAKARELVKLKGTLDCIKPLDKKFREQLLYFSSYTPFIYTTQACQKTCEIRRRKRRFSCFDPGAVINTSDTPPTKWDRERFCDSTEISYDLDQDFKTPCSCSISCSETLLEDSAIHSTTICKQPVVVREGNDTTTIDPTLDPRSCGVVKLSYGNIPYELIQEQRKYSDADFWGIIGGNVGLWVGICIISLLELFELFILFLGQKLQRPKDFALEKSRSLLHRTKLPSLLRRAKLPSLFRRRRTERQ